MNPKDRLNNISLPRQPTGSGDNNLATQYILALLHLLSGPTNVPSAAIPTPVQIST